MHNGRVAVVGIGARRLALEGTTDSTVWAGIAAGDNDGGRLGARGSGARRGRESTPTGLTGLARG